MDSPLLNLTKACILTSVVILHALFPKIKLHMVDTRQPTTILNPSPILEGMRSSNSLNDPVHRK